MILFFGKCLYIDSINPGTTSWKEAVSTHNAWVLFKGYVNLSGSLAYVLWESFHIVSLN